MKNLAFYQTVMNCSTEDEVFDYIMKTLKPSSMLWSYFVNWDKVISNTKQIELALNNLNYLIGKDDFDTEFRFLLKENPGLVKILPALVVRDGMKTEKFNILEINFSIFNPTP